MFTARNRVFIARVLLSVMLFEVFHTLLLPVAKASSPVPNQLMSHVNPFTGDFHYGIPLLSVPGPNGESYPVSLGYMGGIRTEQEASWVGLGWELNPGEISRSVNGMPDDWKREKVYTVDKEFNEDTTRYYGPVYYKEISAATPTPYAMDIYQTRRLMQGGLFEFPNFDDYFASGPVNGKMDLHLLEYAALRHNTNLGYLSDCSGNYFTTRPEFTFRNTLSTVHAHYSDLSEWDEMGSAFRSPEFVNSTSGFGYHGDGFDGRIGHEMYIEYFTNSELNVLSPSSFPKGFLDFRTVTAGQRRNPSEFPGDGIGAFQITGPTGTVYHYSLPVYGSAENSYNIQLNESFGYAPDQVVETMTRNAPYAQSWKLTAITGRDYVDANANGVADPGDKGYWVSFNYGLWTSDFHWKMPFFGYYNDIANSIVPVDPNEETETYKRQGNVNSGKKQVYFLNSIRTSTHTAYFVKEIRQDGHSRKNGSGAVTPQLRLNRIILLRNGEAANSYLTPNTTDPLPLQGFSSVPANPGNVVHIGNYTAHKSEIDAASLRTVELGYDYSLCPGLYNNINNSFTTTPKIYENDGQTVLYESITGASYGSNGGKLTLLSVKTLEKGYVQMFPDYSFTYAKNFDYDHQKADLWGFYKSDYSAAYRGAYTTKDSKNNTDAWSLTGILTPAGATLSVSYESDEYEKVGYTGDELNNLGNPQRIFLIREVLKESIILYDSEAFKFFDSNLKKVDFTLPFATADLDSCTLVFGCSSSDPYYVYKSYSYNHDYPDGSTDFIASPPLNKISWLDYGISPCYTCPESPDKTYDPSVYIGYVIATPYIAYGGGVRVKSISVNEAESGHTYKASFSYENGVATTEPDRFARTRIESLEKSFSNDMHAVYPSVGYSKVTVKALGDDNRSNGKTVLEFMNYKEPFLPDLSNSVYTSGGTTSNQHAFIISENQSLYGRPLSVKHYDEAGQLVSYTLNEYSVPATHITPNITQAFYSCYTYTGETTKQKSVNVKSCLSSYLTRQTVFRDGLVSSVENLSFDPYSSMFTKVRSTDPTNGITETEITPAYKIYPQMGPKVKNPDFHQILSPVALQKIKKKEPDKDLAGNTLASALTLEGGSATAWTKTYDFRSYDAASGKYITQTAPAGTVAGGYWQPLETRVFNGSAADSLWKRTGTITLIDNTGKKVLEEKGITRYSAVKYGYGNQYAVAKVQNANYSSFAFSSFEDPLSVSSSPAVTHFGGEVSGVEKQIAASSTIPAHTGNYLIKLSPSETGGRFYSEVNNQTAGGQLLEKGLQTGRIYRASVWVYGNSSPAAQLVATLSGSLTGGGTVSTTLSRSMDDPANVKAGNWTLLTLDIEVPSNLANGSSVTVFLRNPSTYINLDEVTTPLGTIFVAVPNLLDAWFDDLNFHPVDAPVSGFVYEERTGWLKAVLDNENFATFFDHDAAGRVIFTRKETAQGIKNVSSTLFHNARP
jgi:hypothetical protein